jgi:hypothetical protein
MNGSQDNPNNPVLEPTPQQTPTAEPQAPPTSQAPPVMPQQAAGRFFQMSPAVAQDPRAKSPALACFLSAMPGLGQVYTGYYVRGFTYIIVIAGIITILASGDADDLAPFLGLFLAFFWLHNVIDAGRRAAFYNQTLAGGEADAFPPEMKLPGMGGSIFAGVGLIVVGIIALSYTKYDMSLAWVEDWWPVAPILIGIYLVGLAARDRMKEAA